MSIILLKYWRQILIVILLVVSIGSAGYSIYHKVYNSGYTAASAVYEKQINAYNKKLDERVANIEDISSSISSKLVLQRDLNKKNFASIISTVKNKPLYTVEATTGICKPSTDFLQAYISAINKANGQ